MSLDLTTNFQAKSPLNNNNTCTFSVRCILSCAANRSGWKFRILDRTLSAAGIRHPAGTLPARLAEDVHVLTFLLLFNNHMDSTTHITYQAMVSIINQSLAALPPFCCSILWVVSIIFYLEKYFYYF